MSISPEQALKDGWDYVFGHEDECPLYRPGLRHENPDECACPFDWDSETIEILVEIIFRAIPDYEVIS